MRKPWLYLCSVKHCHISSYSFLSPEFLVLLTRPILFTVYCKICPWFRCALFCCGYVIVFGGFIITGTSHERRNVAIKSLAIPQFVQCLCCHKNQSPVLLALSEGNPPVTGGFPSQRASNREIISTTSSWYGCFFSLIFKLLLWPWNNRMIATVPVKKPCKIWCLWHDSIYIRMNT